MAARCSFDYALLLLELAKVAFKVDEAFWSYICLLESTTLLGAVHGWVAAFKPPPGFRVPPQNNFKFSRSPHLSVHDSILS